MAREVDAFLARPRLLYHLDFYCLFYNEIWIKYNAQINSYLSQYISFSFSFTKSPTMTHKTARRILGRHFVIPLRSVVHYEYIIFRMTPIHAVISRLRKSCWRRGSRRRDAPGYHRSNIDPPSASTTVRSALLRSIPSSPPSSQSLKRKNLNIWYSAVVPHQGTIRLRVICLGGADGTRNLHFLLRSMAEDGCSFYR